MRKKTAKKEVSGPGAARWVRELLAWFEANQRSMPWRARRLPYAIWISEIMLQQTTIAAVVPYFALAGPNSAYTMLLQVQYKIQEGNNGFVIDLSALF